MTLTVEVSLALGADLTASYASWVWTDVTQYVLGPAVSISRGRGDEHTETPPSQCQFTVRNSDGRWCRQNPVGAWYGQLGRNTPVRVRVNPGTGMVTRFTGFIDSLPLRWDQGTWATAQVTASGILRRIQQGSALRSALYRMVTSELYAANSVVGYWPCEDPSGSVAVASGIGGPAGQVSATGVSMAADSSMLGSQPLPTLGAGGFINANVPPYTTSTTWAARWAFKVPSAASGTTHLGWVNTTGDPGSWALYLYNDNTIHLQAWRAGSDVLADAGQPFQDASGLPLTNKQVWISVNATQNGTGIDWRWTLYSSSYTWTGAGNVASSTVGQVSSIGAYGNGSFVGGTYGHVTVGTDTSFVDESAAVTGKADDATFQRLASLCLEENIGYALVGLPLTGMGPQPLAGLLDQLREIERTEESVLFESVDGKVTLWDRRELQNQTVAMSLDVKLLQVADWAPTDDDQRLRNDITVSRPGSNIGARATDVAHARANGVYADQVSVNVLYDSDLPYHASWRLHLGTVNEPRFPQVALNLTATPAKVASWLACDIGSRVQLTSPLAGLPPDAVDLMLQGYTESVDPVLWTATLNCSPYRPWEVFKLEDTRLGRLDTTGSALLTSATSTATSLLVASTSTTVIPPAGFVPWSTTATPYDLAIGGERVTVTTMATNAVSFVNAGTASHADNASVTPGMPASVQQGDLLLVLAAIRNTAATVTTPSGYTVLNNSAGHFALYGKIHTGTESAPTVSFTGGSAGDTTSAQMCAFRNAQLQNVGGASGTNGSQQDIAVGAVNGPPRNRCLLIVAGWKQDDWTSVASLSGFTEIGEPTTVTGNDQGLVWDYQIQTTAASVSATSFTVTGGAAAIGKFLAVLLPGDVQTATVTRSVNTVVKAQTAGTAVSLWRPGVMSL